MTGFEAKSKGKKGEKVSKKVEVISRPFGISVDNFYITDIVGENSAVMAKVSKVRVKNNWFKNQSIYN